VVYKVDRLSRSLLDFASIIGILDKHNATFVSVTQAFNTATSLGRLTLNVLLSFAQFERELVQDRTRDKVHAARRKGKWTGGLPVLGYDIQGGKLTVNEEEAHCVREIFQMFTREQTVIETLYEVDRRGWKCKSWVTQKGTSFGGRRFTRSKLKFMLSNPLYLGKVRLKGALHEGEHPAIVDPDLWRQANELLVARGSGERNKNRSPMEGILRGLLHCDACGSPMVPAYTKRNARKVRYYTCTSAQKHGWKTCPSRSLPASALEESVVSRLSSAPCRTAPESVQGMIERIGYDGRTRQVSILLRQGCVDGKTVHEAPRQQPIVYELPSAARPPIGRKRTGRLPRIERLMALAIRFDDLLRRRTLKDCSELARLGGVSRARVSQIMNLLNLAPDIQERLLSLTPVHTWRDQLNERGLRSVLREPVWMRQRILFASLFPDDQSSCEEQV
jgi:hypothetical protein